MKPIKMFEPAVLASLTAMVPVAQAAASTVNVTIAGAGSGTVTEPEGGRVEITATFELAHR